MSSSSPSVSTSPEKYEMQPTIAATERSAPAPAPQTNFANPLPLGLCSFALGCFVLGLIEMKVKGITTPNILVGLAFGYSGLCQLCAGMWAMAVGNTLAATAMSSYGGFWLSVGVIFTPGGFQVMSTLMEADGGGPGMFYDSFGLCLMGWFIFTTLMMLCTQKSNLAFSSLFFVVDIGVILLACGYLIRDEMETPHPQLCMAGGFFILLSSFLAWYNAIAMMLDPSNSFFTLPVVPFPWSAERKQAGRQQKEAMGLQE